MVTASADGTARLWDAATGAPLGPPMRHQGVVHSAAFSPDGWRVVTASWDRTARVWDVRWPQGSITEVACALLGGDTDVAGLAERYGIVVREAICGPDVPEPDLARLTGSEALASATRDATAARLPDRWMDNTTVPALRGRKFESREVTMLSLEETANRQAVWSSTANQLKANYDRARK